MDFKTAAEMRYNITPAPSFQEEIIAECKEAIDQINKMEAKMKK